MSEGATREDAAGGHPEAVTTRLPIPEMDCPTCVGKVDRSLERIEGVVDVTLQSTTGMATVQYDPTLTSVPEIVAAIEKAGYEVPDEGRRERDASGEPEIAPPSQVWRSSRAIKTWIGAVFLTAGLLVEFVFVGQNPVVASVLEYPLTLGSVLFLVAIVSSGVPVVRGGYYSARNLSLDIDLLMSVAIIAATAIGYFVEAATLAVLFSIAELLEDYAMDRARDSLRELMELSPEEATVRRDGEEVTVPTEDVEIGETVLVRPGEKIPLDGVVREGESAVDESPITGESVPVDKTSDDEVYAGGINEEGYLEVAVTSTAAESTLSRIIDLVQSAQEQKTEKEQFVDRFAGYYTPVVVALAILTAAIPPLALGWPWETWFIRGLTLLVIACPCAFVISTPVSVVSGITSAAKNGVLIKGGNHLEAMGEVRAVALDKTGTLTRGELSVTDVVPVGVDGHPEDGEQTVLRYVAALEQRSEHPIAEAIRTHADEREVADRPEPSAFESLTGRGIRGEIDGETYYAGKPALFEELGFELSTAGNRAADGGAVPGRVATASTDDPPSGFRETIEDLQRAGKTVVLVGTASTILGAIAIADEVRPGAERAV
ncbi:MAG: heavy metal translocating P-type ATPase, partial [Haloferacaceae archaeon]